MVQKLERAYQDANTWTRRYSDSTTTGRISTSRADERLSEATTRTAAGKTAAMSHAIEVATARLAEDASRTAEAADRQAEGADPTAEDTDHAAEGADQTAEAVDRRAGAADHQSEGSTRSSTRCSTL